MTVQNGYVTLTVVKSELGIPDTNDDAKLERVIRDVSRAIDTICGKTFFPRVQTRYYTPGNADRLIIDELIAVTALKTDEDGDRTYENTWAATDYDLTPDNAALESPPSPYWAVEVTPDGDYTFPTGIRRGVQLAGTWGHYEVAVASGSLLNEVLDVSETAVDVDDGTDFDAGQLILVESEQMLVESIASNVLTVVRAYNGTTAATHADDTVVNILTFPIVAEAALLLVSRYFRRKDAPLGVVGGGEMGVQIVRADPDAMRLLSPLIRRTVA